ncbi:phosphopantetheine-binding protein [Sorangium sp. So ce375]|uniref:phosphopantetheine-binding protein n=1 Tax=Sorangium sp. So ce375 TaxID=3133306 RepID=UPI003F5BC009
MPDDSIKGSIRTMMSRSFNGRALGDDDDIFALGFGNSLFAIQLVAFIEREFNIEIDGSDLDMANFKSIDAIAKLVQSKLDSGA